MPESIFWWVFTLACVFAFAQLIHILISSAGATPALSGDPNSPSASVDTRSSKKVNAGSVKVYLDFSFTTFVTANSVASHLS